MPNQKPTMSYFYSSFLIAIGALVLGFLMDGFQGAMNVGVLSVLETSLSFDNAVVNATILVTMTALWRHRFVTWGMLIAVFGMRFVFPIIIVSIMAGISPAEATNLAFTDSAAFSAIIHHAIEPIMAFGGAFLILVGMEFMLDEKDARWIPWLEKAFETIRFHPVVNYVVALGAVMAYSMKMEDQQGFIIAGIGGMATFMVLAAWKHFMEKKEEARKEKLKHADPTLAAKVTGGFATFVYLEVIDASFSFDGVVGAFALTDNLIVMLAGLTAGAMFVRSLTLLFADRGVLKGYRYLEHGAFYAIIVLALMMFTKAFHEVPEWITGLSGGALIGFALISSIIANSRDMTANVMLLAKSVQDNQSVRLMRNEEEALDVITIGLGWSGDEKSPIDVDLVAVCLDNTGHMVETVNHTVKSGANGAIQLDLDNTIGANVKGSDLEFVTAYLGHIPENVATIHLVATTEGKANADMSVLSWLDARVYVSANPSPKRVFAEYAKPVSDVPVTAIHFTTLTRNGDVWVMTTEAD